MRAQQERLIQVCRRLESALCTTASSLTFLRFCIRVLRSVNIAPGLGATSLTDCKLIIATPPTLVMPAQRNCHIPFVVCELFKKRSSANATNFNFKCADLIMNVEHQTQTQLLSKRTNTDKIKHCSLLNVKLKLRSICIIRNDIYEMY